MTDEVTLNDDITQEVIDAVEQLEDKAEAEKKDESKAEKPKADKTFTQADVDRIVQERLARNREENEKNKADADKWRKAEREKLPREQQLLDRIAELETLNAQKDERVTGLELEKLRADVAHEKKLTAKQASRLKGSTREELEADADDLLEAFPQRKSPSQQPIEELTGGGKPEEMAPKFNRDDVLKNIPSF